MDTESDGPALRSSQRIDTVRALSMARFQLEAHANRGGRKPYGVVQERDSTELSD